MSNSDACLNVYFAFPNLGRKGLRLQGLVAPQLFCSQFLRFLAKSILGRDFTIAISLKLDVPESLTGFILRRYSEFSENI